MIKFAVSRPKERLKSIAHGIGMLKWHEDPYLSHYGVRIDPNLTVVSTLASSKCLKPTISRHKPVFCRRRRFNITVLLPNLAILVAGTSVERNSSTLTLFPCSLGASAFLNKVSTNPLSSTSYRSWFKLIFRMAAEFLIKLRSFILPRKVKITLVSLLTNFIKLLRMLVGLAS
jgi:hypothetical protein